MTPVVIRTKHKKNLFFNWISISYLTATYFVGFSSILYLVNQIRFNWELAWLPILRSSFWHWGVLWYIFLVQGVLSDFPHFFLKWVARSWLVDIFLTSHSSAMSVRALDIRKLTSFFQEFIGNWCWCIFSAGCSINVVSEIPNLEATGFKRYFTVH